MKLRAALIFVLAVMLLGLSAWSQEVPPKWEVSLDYTYSHYNAVDYEQPSYSFGQWFGLEGGGGGVVYNFRHDLGFKAEFQGYNSDKRDVTVPPGYAYLPQGGTALVSGDLFTYMFGPEFGITHGKLRPFAEALVGGAHSNVYNNAFKDLNLAGVSGSSSNNAFAWSAGLGLDIGVSRHLAIRPFEIDYLYTDFSSRSGLSENQNGWRYLGGVVFTFGGKPPVPITLACSASPATVYPGDPVTVTGTADLLNPKLKAVYTWSGSGVTGNGTTASVSTGSLAPGTYTVNGSVTEGPKPWQTASCSATFTVKQFEPPTVSCSANPSTIKPGDTSTITASGVSPQNRPLTYSYSASAGSVSGSGNSGTYSSAGAPPGPATVTCTVTDDKGQSASGTTTVTIEAPPPPPPAPEVSSLCSLGFSKDTKRPTRVDNEAKACLDDVALTLQSRSDAALAIVGSSTAAEKAPPKKQKKGTTPIDFAAQRAVNAKDYLVTEKGIDASRISVYTGTADEQKVEDYLVPSGATFNVPGATPVAGDVQPQHRVPLGEKQPSKKAAQ